MKNKTCIIVSGPTAVGKTSYGIELAQKHNTQIISADSRQCFKELNIGVAKPSLEQLQMVDHYFINSHCITDEVNAKVFEQYALNVIKDIFNVSDVAIMVGGTGLYIKAFCEGLDVPSIKTSVRNDIEQQYNIKGLSWLQNEVKREDLQYFLSGEMQNPQRIMRALEVKISTGNSILQYHLGNKKERVFKIEHVYLNVPREELYSRIDSRVDEMMHAGLLKEAEGLFNSRLLNALQTVGYKELFEYIEEKISLDEAVNKIKKNTRHFAKRQITWFKKFHNARVHSGGTQEFKS